MKKLKINKYAGIYDIVCSVIYFFSIFMLLSSGLSEAFGGQEAGTTDALRAVLVFIAITGTVLHIVALIKSKKVGISTTGNILGIIAHSIFLLSPLLSLGSFVLCILSAIFTLKQKNIDGFVSSAFANMSTIQDGSQQETSSMAKKKMSKKTKIIISSSIAIVLLTFGVIGFLLPKAEDPIYTIGDTYQTKSKMAITINEINRYETFDEYFTPSEGNNYLLVNVTLQNNSNEVKGYNPLDFQIQDANGVIHGFDFIIGIPDQLNSGDLAANGNITGNIAFEVPNNLATEKILMFDNIFSSTPIAEIIYDEIDYYEQ